jgi:hypothetical protein
MGKAIKSASYEMDPIEGYCMDNVVNENGSKAIETEIGTQSRGEKVV